jgi:hypothetical protein
MSTDGKLSADAALHWAKRRAAQYLHDTCGIPLKNAWNMLDHEWSLTCGAPRVDLLALDDYLHRRFGDYEDEGLSMKDMLAAKFGAACAQRIDRLIGATFEEGTP